MTKNTRMASWSRAVAAVSGVLLATGMGVIAQPSPAVAADCTLSGPLTEVTGDWDGNGTTTIGVVDQTSRWALRNSNTPGAADLCFRYGSSNTIPVVGDWDGDGVDTVGVVQWSGGTFVWHLRNSNTAGAGELSFAFGDPIKSGQFAAVDEILTGRENLILVARLRHLKDVGAIADDLLRRFSLTEAGAAGWPRTPGACAAGWTSR